MKKARNDQFFSNLEKFVNKVYPNQPQRQYNNSMIAGIGRQSDPSTRIS